MNQSSRAGECTPNTGPDVIVGDLVGWSKWGTVGGISAYSFGTTSCNVGDQILPWIAHSHQHPVIAMHAFRLKTVAGSGRFEQIGLSWLKHGWGALTENACCICVNPNNFEALGVGCSDPYDAGLNGDQNGFNDGQGIVAGLGPRSEVNPFTGVFPWPYGTQGAAGNAIYKRLQIHSVDLDPAQNAGASYFAECQYVTPDDAAAGNHFNNHSYRRFMVGSFTNGSWTLAFNAGFLIQREKAAIEAWKDADPQVTLATVDVPGNGRFLVASRATETSSGMWHYEYAVQNLNASLNGRGFAVEVGVNATVANIGFHDVDHHSGEPYDDTDWAGVVSANEIRWNVGGSGPNTNQLRWGTLYNFRFDTTRPPQIGLATLFVTTSGDKGINLQATAVVPMPAPLHPADVTGDGNVNVDDLLAVINAWGQCIGCPADVNDDNLVNVDDLLAVINKWG